MANTWATQLDPVIEKPIVQGQLLEGISLIVGTNVINHKLGRKLQGWMIVDIDGIAEIYRTNPTQMPNLTLSLISDAAVTVSLWVL